MTLFRSIAVLGLLVAGLSNAFARSGALDARELSQEQSSKPAFLGVEMDDIEGPGVLVTRVVSKSAAATAGLRAGDRIIGIAGTATDTVGDVQAILGKHAPGDSVQLVFRRDRELLVAQTALGERPEGGTPRPGRVASVLEVLRPRQGQVVADIGFGGGWLSLGLAEAVGSEGLVYAVEIDASAVQKMRERGLSNIEAVLSKQDDITLPEGSLDFAVLHDVASHVSKEARPSLYASIARALKSDGRLTIFGPHGKARSMLDELKNYGFHAEDEVALAELSREELDARLDEGIRFFYEEETRPAF